MGGTSCDVCLIVDGEPLYSSDFEIEFGLPVSVPSVSTRTIGAGGGSIGWVDPGGFLQVGPQSAGAAPGPACYGQGGESATITDADLVLGRLDPAFFLGGKLPLDPALARSALDGSARSSACDGVETASAMVRICNENMANAIRILTVEQGIDPREFALIAFGGAGRDARLRDRRRDRHAPRVVPPRPGLCSAFGALAAIVRVDAVRSVYLTDRTTSAAELDALFARARGAGAGRRRRPGPRAGAHRAPRRSRCATRARTTSRRSPCRTGTLDEAALAEVYAEYGRLYEGFYGYRLDGIPIELVRLSVVAMGEPPVFAGLPSEEAESEGARRGARSSSPTPASSRPTSCAARRSPRASSAPGPLIVESMDSTVVVPPGWTLAVPRRGILDLTRA